MKHPSLFYRAPEAIYLNFKMLKLLFDNNDDITREAVLRNPILLSYSEERDFIHHLDRELTGETTRLGDNPEQIIRKHLASIGGDSDKMDRILKEFRELYGEFKKQEKKRIKQGRTIEVEDVGEDATEDDEN